MYLMMPNGTSTANSLPGPNTVTAFGQNNHGDGVKNLGVCLALFNKTGMVISNTLVNEN